MDCQRGSGDDQHREAVMPHKLKEPIMRKVLMSLCLLTTACGGTPLETPTAPAAATAFPAEARNGSALPFSGRMETSEVADGSMRHLTGSGRATHLGRFTMNAEMTVLPPPLRTGSGPATWTAANGDRLYTDSVGQAAGAFPTIVLTETHTITGGTGRFAGATGSFIVVRTLNLQTSTSTATLDGTIDLNR